jgi:hypothetical protein
MIFDLSLPLAWIGFPERCDVVPEDRLWPDGAAMAKQKK